MPVNNLFGNFIWAMGMVENRNDPKKMGRCQVRIVGYHTDDKTILPTEQLPWAMPIQPITSAAISGVGSSPLGPVEGTWVVGWFLDGEDMQQFAFFGTIGGISGENKTFKPVKQSKEGQQIINLNTGNKTDSSGNPVKDSKGNEVKVATPSVSGWKLGQTSEKYESGGKGPGVINAYQNSGDFGGASYGTYQFASFLPETMPSGKKRTGAKNSPLIQYLNTSKFKEKFIGLTPATAEFDTVWKSIASSNSAEFKEEQHEYIKSKYYDVMMSSLKKNGFDLYKFGPAVHDLVWSTAVQYGPGKLSIFTVPLRAKSEFTDTDIVNLVSQYKIDTVDSNFPSSSAAIRAGVKSRYVSERTALLALIK